MTIGIENLPNQKHRRSSKRGCHLTLMTVGPSGVGKTTFINTLFTTSLCTHRDVENRFTKEETSKIKITEADLEEKGFRLKLSLIDTPGFGDRVNNASSWAPIVEYIDAQYSTYLNQEMRADRTGMSDSRVHACLYFIEPNGHGLKPLDVTAMKELGNRVNLIPVIAKADTITLDEMATFKAKIRDQIEKHDIRIYRPPVQSDDEEATKRNAEIATAIPFSIIGSEETITVGGQPIRGRQYTWGVAEVENDKHCDFKKLRSLLLRTHLLDLIVTTEETHYENFRDSKLVAGGLTADMTPEKLARQLDLKIKEQEEAIKKKLSEQVKQEDQRFKTWSEKLAGDRDRLNKEIETMRKEVEDLKNVVKNLQDQRTAQTAGKKK